jgi:hypothetical protein
MQKRDRTCHCFARSENECSCPDADWTPAEVYRLRAENEALRYELDWLKLNASNNNRLSGYQKQRGEGTE